QDGFIGNIGDGSPGDVIQDDRQVDGLGGGLEVLVQALLGRLVVVGNDRQPRLRAYVLGILGKLDGLVGGVSADTGNDGQAPRRVLDRYTDELGMFFHADRGRFARSADDHQRVGTLGDMPVDQFSIGVEVE